jgi:hypothetical protein
MAETTLIDDEPETRNLYGITPEMREKYRKKLEQMMKEQGIKPAQTNEDLYRHSEDLGQNQEEIQAEVDEFLQMLEEDRKLSLERER